MVKSWSTVKEQLHVKATSKNRQWAAAIEGDSLKQQWVVLTVNSTEVKAHKGNTVNNDIGEQARVDLAGGGDAGVAPQQSPLIVLRLAVPRQPDLAHARHARLAHLRRTAHSSVSQCTFLYMLGLSHTETKSLCGHEDR